MKNIAVSKIWNERAQHAEHTIVNNFLKRLWFLPGTQLALPGKPARISDRLFFSWNYWWQAHLLDCVIDSYLRQPHPFRYHLLVKILRSIKIRNLGTLINNYYDDMAWLALALQRAKLILSHRYINKNLLKLKNQFYQAWKPELGGGMLWRKTDIYFNTPANGPIGIFFARENQIDIAVQIFNWLTDNLFDYDTGLIWDGIKSNGYINKDIYPYCQGVYLGLAIILNQHQPADEYLELITKLVTTISTQLTYPNSYILKTTGGGDGGLFTGILVRYLALVITKLSNKHNNYFNKKILATKQLAQKLILNSAAEVWKNRIQKNNWTIFSANWNEKATLPTLTAGNSAKFISGTVKSSKIPERDVSVQLSAWMLFEIAAQVAYIKL